MALVRVSRKCFKAFDEVCEAVERSDPNRAAIILQSIQSDAEILQIEARILQKQLLKAEEKNEAQVENLTKKINNLFQHEQQFKRNEKNLNVKISGFEAKRKQHQENQNAARRKYEAARAKQREAEEKVEELKSFWWVPGYGTYLAIRELAQGNENLAYQAEREKNRYDREVEEADREIRSTNNKINQIHKEIERIQKNRDKMMQERKKIHEELGEFKSMTIVVLEVLSFSEVLINLAGEASLKSDYLQRIMELAGKKKTDIRQSRGIRTAVNSFEDSWINIIDLLKSNQIVILNDRRIDRIYEASYKNTHLFDILIVCVAVLKVLLYLFDILIVCFAVLMVLLFCFVFRK